MTRALPALLLAAALAAAQEDPFADELAAGIERFRAGAYEEALGAFARARTLRPGDWRGHAWQAFTRLEQAKRERDEKRRAGLLDEAEAMAGALVTEAGLRFRDPLYLYVVGSAHSLRGDHEEAYAKLRAATVARPDQMQAYAEIDLLRVARQAYAYASMDLGRLSSAEGKFEEAEPRLREARRILEELEERSPAYVLLRRELAVVHEALGRWERAIEDYEACIELHDDEFLDTAFRASIAMLYLRNGETEKGEQALAKLPKDTSHPEVLFARGFALSQRAERDPAARDEALAHYRMAMERSPDPRLVEAYAALVLGGEPDEALLEDLVRRLMRAVELRPQHAPPYRLLAEAHKLLGHEEEALRFEALHEQIRKAAEPPPEPGPGAPR